MRKRLGPVLFSVVYWWVALTLLGLIGVVHGECFNDAQCESQKSTILWIGAALAVAIYAWLLHKRVRVGRKRN